VLHPAVAGPVTVELEHFDPLSRWQYQATLQLTARGGLATATFTPPTPGRWRVSATFTGTRIASPSQSGFAQLLAAGPLVQ
jgi:hypothetical protein